MADGGDDLMTFRDDADSEPPRPTGTAWQVLVVDDEPAVHAVTRMVLGGVEYLDRPIQMWEALSAADGYRVLAEHPDIAVVIIDVVMETDDAGLRLVGRVREELGNDMVRIIMRTGQPGFAPERAVVLGYDINDYKEKQELTTDRLITSIVTALRSYQALAALKQAYAELSMAQNRLAESEKLAALGGLVAGLTHEVNTPLGACVQAASHLQDAAAETRARYVSQELTPDDFEDFLGETEKASRILLTASQTAARLIGGFKTMAVDQASGARRVFQLAEIVDDVLISLTPRLRRSPNMVEVDCKAGIDLDSYPGAVSQILTNLVVNSMVHGFEGIDRPGKITIQATHDAAADRVTLVYRDNGRGIPDEHRARVFEPFFTTKRGKGGSGVGLNMVQTLVNETLGGAITLDTAVDAGVTFTMSLPRKAPR